MKKYTDKELLDFLQAKNEEATHTGRCLFRMSSFGQGWRLHETSRKRARKSVRKAIGDAIDRKKKSEKK